MVGGIQGKPVLVWPNSPLEHVLTPPSFASTDVKDKAAALAKELS
jgi:hypothetical protein